MREAQREMNAARQTLQKLGNSTDVGVSWFSLPEASLRMHAEPREIEDEPPTREVHGYFSRELFRKLKV